MEGFVDVMGKFKLLSSLVVFSISFTLSSIILSRQSLVSFSLRNRAAFSIMPRGIKKENLPFKICIVCNRPYNWRKKWEKCWDEVTTCSNSCNRQRRMMKQPSLHKTSIVYESKFGNHSDNLSYESDGSGTLSGMEALKGDDVDIDENIFAISQTLSIFQTVEIETVEQDVKVNKSCKRIEKLKGGDNIGAAQQKRKDHNGSKACDKCGELVDTLIRCRTDRSRDWHMVCNICWPFVSGGVTDGDDAHPYYQYGGLWKNRRKMILDRLCDLFILHRGLDPNDEDSTVEEQVEKLLYIFSKDAGDTNERVQLLTSVEALMELSKSFMGQSLETTIMNDKMWSFYECEPGIWLVLSVRNDHAIATEAGETLELLSSYGCRLFLNRLYSLLYSMVGSLQTYLIGVDEEGWACIQRIISARKLVRKTQMKLGNAQNDLEKLHDDLRDGVERDGMEELMRQSNELIKDLTEKLLVAREELSVEVISPKYRLPQLKDKLSSFMVWYLSIEDFNSVSCLASTFDVIDGKLRDRAASGTIHRVMRSVHAALPNMQASCILTFDNRLLWSEVDSFTTSTIVDFLSRWDSSFLISQPNLQLRKAMQDFAKSIYQETRCDYASLDANQKLKLVESVRELEERKQQRIGVMTQRGQYISFDKYSVRLPSIQRISELRSRNMYSVPEEEQSLSNDTDKASPYSWPVITTKETIAATSSSSARKRLAQGLTFFDSLDMGDGNAIVCNPIFPVGAASTTNRVPLGRALYLFFGRLVLTVVIPQEQMEALHSKEFKALIWSYTSPTLSVATPNNPTPQPPQPPSTSEIVGAAIAAETNHTAVPTPAATANSSSTVNTTTTNNNDDELAGKSATTNKFDDSVANATIAALQINSIRMTRLVEKIDQIVRDASYPRMTHFNDYDKLSCLQLDIAKLKVMYIAKKVRDAVIGDISLLETAVNSTESVSIGNTSSGLAGRGPVAPRRGNNINSSNVSPMRGSLVMPPGAAAIAILSTSSSSGAGGISSASTSLRRDSAVASPMGNTGSGGMNASGGNLSSGNSGGNTAQSQLFIQLQHAQTLVNRASPGTLRGMLLPKVVLPSNDKEARAICVSPAYTAIRTFSLDPDSLVYTLTQPDYGSNSSGSSSHHLDAAIDRYFLSLSRYSEPALLVVQCVLYQMGFPVVRAVHDVWSRLNPLPPSLGASSPVTATASNAIANYSYKNNNVIATRISTPQRGGVWVVGSRILNKKPMLVVVTNCATFDEVMDIFDILGQEASS